MAALLVVGAILLGVHAEKERKNRRQLQVETENLSLRNNHLTQDDSSSIYSQKYSPPKYCETGYDTATRPDQTHSIPSKFSRKMKIKLGHGKHDKQSIE